jgi:DNA (cytosine-5)-methyltransferase 1
VIDSFAGPGGLGEGFSAFQDKGIHPFKIALSVEKEAAAHETLRLRSFFRQFPQGRVPDLYYDVLRRQVPLSELPDRLKTESGELFAKWQAADAEAMHAELGAEDTRAEISRRIRSALGGKDKHWVLIGGPPCQAYSIVGRVRNRGVEKYTIDKDKRSTLYQEYLRIIAEHQPSIFVMENVKGMLSATVENQGVFNKILDDLKSPPLATTRNGQPLRYRVVPIVKQDRPRRDGTVRPTDFVVACEKYGVPQQRHRVILVGVREDLGEIDVPALSPSTPPTVQQTIGALPRLRSGLSRRRQGDHYVPLQDSPELWLATIRDWTTRDGDERRWLKKLAGETSPDVYESILTTVASLKVPSKGRGSEFVSLDKSPSTASSLKDWLVDEHLKGVCNHKSRVHMDSDLARYLFAACHAQVFKDSPKLNQFPADLQPNHKNATDKDLIFDDRFRVQLAGSVATTVTSHLSKDGHYFIHYDPAQCRSMTVREVARLQTFPDNYFFCGPRTSQYVQVGNAVPPWVARQIAECVWQALVQSGKVG